MQIELSDQAKRQLKKLPASLRDKTRKSFSFLLSDYRHPSLRSRKMQGKDKYEARIDYHYRFSYQIIKGTVFILTIGPHDTGLGKN